MKKIFLIFLLLVSLFNFKQATAATVPSDWKFIPTDLQNTTATFRLLFVTSDRTQAVEKEIEYYNNFVQNAALSNPALASFANEFRALGSTSATNARDNTNTNPASHTGYPIYFLGGHKLANNYAGFYGFAGWNLPTAGFPQHPDSLGFSFYQYDELGNIVEPSNTRFNANNPDHRVWVGSLRVGIADSDQYFGDQNVKAGYNDIASELTGPAFSATDRNHLYGLSPSITIDPNFATYSITDLTISVPDFIIQGDDFNGEATATGLNSTGTINLNNFISRPTVNTNKLGRNVVTYTIADSAGSETISKSGVVYVVSKNKLDIDNNGQLRASTDGVILYRYINNIRNNLLIRNTLAKNSAIDNVEGLLGYLNFINADDIFNVDSGTDLDNNDSYIILRYLIGIRGFGLTNGLTFSGTRTSAASITNYLDNLQNPRE